MKQLALIISTILLFNCSSKQNKNNETTIDEKSYESIRIDTLTYKVNAEDSVKCGYYINQFNYPQISGLSNTKFQKELNDNFTESVKPYIESIESNIKTYNYTTKKDNEPIEGGLENYSEDIPGELYISFDVLSSDSIISIIQHFGETVGNHGNGRMVDFNITNYNTLKGTFLNNSDLNTNSYTIAFLNERIKTYFDKRFPEEKVLDAINYPLIENSIKLKDLYYGVRNDSIMLVLVAMPSANYSYGTYIIPIDKWKK
jgi:hypothetical protein